MLLLHLCCPLLGDVVIEVLPGAAKRLPREPGLIAKPLAVNALQGRESLVVKGVPVAGNYGHERGKVC